jgi:hypothetical protein
MDRFICSTEMTEGIFAIIVRAAENGYFRDRRRKEQ